MRSIGTFSRWKAVSGKTRRTAHWSSRAAKDWREERIARAPDPFLENAVQPAMAGTSPGPAPSDATPPKKQDKGDDSTSNEKKKKNGGGK